MNRKAESNAMSIFVIVVVGLLLAYAFNIGELADRFPLGDSESSGSSGEPTQETTKNCPTTGTTTYTINVQDELTSTATNVNAEYYIFNGNKLIKEGTTGSDGTVDVDVTCGKDYKLLLLNTSTGVGNGYYAKEFDLNARISEDTFNAELVNVGGGKILGIENPADPSRNPNVTITAGQTKQFDLKFVANETEDGYNRPLIMCQVNISSIKTVEINSFSDGSSVVSVITLPKRITATSGYAYYAWEYPKILKNSDGVITASGSLTALGSVTPGTADSMQCKLVDQAMWKTSGYKTSSSISDGFKTGPENTETLGDVGGPDSTVARYEFNTNSGGY